MSDDMAKDGRPLCSTCTYHEKQSTRINFMWGAGWSFVIIIGTIVAILVNGQRDNSKNISMNSARITTHERIMQTSVHELEQTLTIMSINQKRQMEASGVPYLDPERVHQWGGK